MEKKLQSIYIFIFVKVTRGTHAVWDQLDCYSAVITTFERQKQARFSDINVRVDDLITRIEVLSCVQI